MDYSAYLIDAIPVAILILTVLICKHKGFAGIVMSVIAVCVCMGFASQYASPVSEWITEHIIHPRLVSHISEALISGIANGQTTLREMLPRIFTEYSGFGADMQVKTELVNTICEKTAAGVEKAAVVPMLRSLMFVLVYAAARFISRIFIKAADLLLKLPIIEQLNHGLGAALGAILGLVLAIMSIMIIVSVSRFVPQTQFETLVSQTKLIIPLYEKLMSVI